MAHRFRPRQHMSRWEAGRCGTCAPVGCGENLMHHTSSSVMSYLEDGNEGAMLRNTRRGRSAASRTVGHRSPCWASAQAADHDERCRSNAAELQGRTGMLACRCRGKAVIWSEGVSARAADLRAARLPEMQHVRRHVALHLRENANTGNAQATVVWSGNVFAAEVKRKARIADETDDVGDLRQMQRQRAGGRRCCHAHAAG